MLTTALSFFLAPVYRAYAISTLTFSEPIGYQTETWQDVKSATTADVDNDGDQDLVSGLLSGAIQTRLNDGTGTFGPILSSTVAGGVGAWWVTAGNFNGDAYVDVAVANFWEKQLQVLFGDGTGIFANATIISTDPGRPLQVIAADFDDDGSLDLAAAGLTAGGDPDGLNGFLSVVLNEGSGTFGTATTTTTQAYYGSRGVASADVNDDGNLDLLVGQDNSSYYGGYGRDVGVFLGDGSGSFTHSNDVGIGIGVRGIQVADLNDDGKTDLIATWRNAWYSQYHGTSVALGNGDGTFGSATLLSGSLNPGSDIAVPTTADFNQDGVPDILVPINSQNKTQVFAGAGNGTFAEPVSPLANPYALAVYSAAPADLNDDGLPDIVTGNHGWTQAGNITPSSTGVIFNTTVTEVPPQITGVPTITGDAVEAQMLSAHTDSLVVTGDPTPDTALQWQVSDDGSSGWTGIPDATAATFTLTDEQVGKYVRLLFTASSSAGSAQAESAATEQVAAAPKPTPTPTETPTPTTSPTPPAPQPTPSNALPPQLAQACPSGNCAGADLNGLDLAGLNLRGIDFAGANLTDANLRGADLRGANLSGATLPGADLRGADLRTADLRKARFSTRVVRGDVVEFRGADLRGANLRSANLTAAKLAGSDLHKADLRKAIANRADFRAAKAKRAKFNRAKLNRANFNWANVSYANFSNAKLKNARFAHADTTGTTFNR